MAVLQGSLDAMLSSWTRGIISVYLLSKLTLLGQRCPGTPSKNVVVFYFLFSFIIFPVCKVIVFRLLWCIFDDAGWSAWTSISAFPTNGMGPDASPAPSSKQPGELTTKWAHDECKVSTRKKLNIAIGRMWIRDHITATLAWTEQSDWWLTIRK